MSQKVSYRVENDEFIIENYNKAKPFASFFPGIAGIWGKPMWVFYVNRGQAISCFGTKDKNGAITEFLAANKAYRLTPTHGFRTFIVLENGDGSGFPENQNRPRFRFHEPFQSGLNDHKIIQTMSITSSLLTITEKNPEVGLEISVEYFTLPHEIIPVLARRLYIKNISNSIKQFKCLDGLPMVNPYGTHDYLLKNMSRLAEGWFSGVEFTKHYQIPIYKLKVEPEDRPEIITIESGNFYAGYYYNKNKQVVSPEYIIDPDLIFGEMKDYQYPETFIQQTEFKNDKDVTAKNKTPCGMGYFTVSLDPNEDFQYYSFVGNVQKISDADLFMKRAMSNEYFEKKQEENNNLIQSIGNKILTKSSSPEWDNYTQQTFIDNLLRGGFPVTIGSKEKQMNTYVYSRIHGDMEREYNQFVILPEYFSQGTGNYRDVNQNRRSDVFFNPEVKDESIIYFMNLIQLDGFNPLKILGYKIKVKNKNAVLKLFNLKDKSKISRLIEEPFSLGNFFNFLEKENIKSERTNEKLLDRIIDVSERIDYAEHGEGYWSDHWHYNLDLIESYLAVYPDELDNLFLKKKVFTFYDNVKVVVPRSQKHVLFHNKPRQFNSVQTDETKKKMIGSRSSEPNVVRTKYGQGSIYKTTLINKLLSLIANKYASLDPEGVGVEMESGKPNWCDALNGLAGLFGSSTAESLELKRFILFLLDVLGKMNVKDTTEIKITREIAEFLVQLESITKKQVQSNFKFWDETHTVKEKYWSKTRKGVSGEEKGLQVARLKSMLHLFLDKLNSGLKKAMDKASGVINTSFENEPIKYKVLKTKNKDGLRFIQVTQFKQIPLKLFLEGPVHYLRINQDREQGKRFHENVMKSGLYDKELKMFKVNAPLEDTSINIGRIKIFTPGWLENESIWLHMEYKYLFELLRNGMEDEFYKLMKTTMVPFMNPHVYGRSIFENVSFIASSGHPEKSTHGQGFVARLSGSTAEFVSIWISMTSGLKPFFMREGELCLQFRPQLASWMFTNKQENVKILNDTSQSEEIVLPENSFMYKFLGMTILIYHNPACKDTFGKNKAKIKEMKIIYFNGKEDLITGEIIFATYSLDIRQGKVKQIDVYLE